MEDTFIIQNSLGVNVRCKILGTYELDNDNRKFIAYTDYRYNKDLKYNVYFSELVSKTGEDVILADIEDDEILNAVTNMFREGVSVNND